MTTDIQTDTDLITVTFADWLFNAGILGFTRIMTQNDNTKIIFNSNSISFKRSDLEGFSDKYFTTAFNQYGRFNRNLQEFRNFINEINEISDSSSEQDINEKKLKKILEKYKYIRAAKLLDTKLKERDIIAPSFNDLKKDPKIFISVLERTIKVLEDNKEEFFESDVQIYLRWIYGQKSFLNNSVTKDRLKKFKKDFEDPLISNSNKQDKKLYCLNCCERKAKKDINFDTGLSPFLGVNTDSVNYLWNFDPRIPLCEICELIYFCYFAGFTDIVKGKERKFYFINSDSNFVNLKNDNSLFKAIVKDKDIVSNDIAIPKFILESVIKENEKSKTVTNNKVLIELDLTNETFPKVFSLNINKGKAEFIKENIDKIYSIAKTSYSIKDYNQNIVIEFIDHIIKSKVSYSYLNKLSKYYVASLSDNKDFYKCYFNYYHLQELNLLTWEYIKKIYKGGLNMNETDIKINELWVMYNEGINLKTSINQGHSKDERSQNDKKYKGLAHKLLNCLRIGDSDQFLNLVMRTYIANEKVVPSIFIKAIKNKENFYPIGYSFVNGLLGEKQNKESDKNKGENQDG